MDTKTIAFVLMMGLLGNLLFGISYHFGYLAPGIALDFSLIAVFIAGYYGGPWIGFISGLFAGIFAGVQFGPMGMGSWLGLVGLPIGKGLTGLTSGVIAKSLRLGKRPYSSVITVPATFLAYVPECIFTYAYFAYLMPVFLGKYMLEVFIYFILPKALSEVLLMSLLMGALRGNHGFNELLDRFFVKPATMPMLRKERTN
ncbi:MAG: hypothetical protein QXJ02_03925 [Candidatus Bathyarchaeia archaeon]